jgi:Bifunctional DNA primase/polymerase, N-terminal/Primase C terminal 2 (PriCT-2)
MKREQPPRERTPYEEFLVEQDVAEAEYAARYEAYLEEQAEQEEPDEDIYTPMFRAVLKLVRKHDWKLFPANLELKNAKFNKKSFLSKDHAPGGENWGMSSDLGQLEENFCGPWWQDKCGIGVPTGADNEIFVIEADTKKGHGVDGIAALKALEAQHEPLPETLMAESPSGSLHFYFQHPGKGIKVKNSTSELAPGVDCRGDGGMVIAPPSRRGDGRYRWLNALPIAEASPWLLDLVIQHDTDHSKSKKDTSKKKSNGAAGAMPVAELSADEALAAYAVIPNDDVDWEEWNRLGMAGWSATAGAGFAGFDAWSQKSSKYNTYNTSKKWQAYFSSPPTEIGAGTLIMLANEADPNWRNAYRAKVQEEQAWPTLAPEALYGLAGEVVGTIEPHTESDPVALQLQFLAAFGNAIGRGPYFMIEGTRHYTNLFGVLVGDTSKSRKGTAGDRIRQVMRLVDPVWEKNRIRGGLSSGEGLIWQIRDEVTKTNKNGKQIIVTDGVEDKRLLLDEREFYASLTVMKREGNTASPLVRAAWDGKPLISLTKNSPAQCMEPHVSLIGHITEDELRDNLDQTAEINARAATTSKTKAPPLTEESRPA